MLTRLLTLRRQAAANATGHVDRRSGAPARHRPDPMPRLRWYT
jgi:hypothetical protein